MPISINSFAIVVAAMRAAQKDYFRTRDTYYLKQSKSYEKEVDALVEQILNPPTQKSLFDVK